VTAPDFQARLKELEATLTSIEKVLDLDKMRGEIADLEREVAAPDLWDDTVNAQRVTSRLSALQSQVEHVTSLRSRLDDVSVLAELADEEDDAGSFAEAQTELGRLSEAIEALEVRTLLSGEYDERDALLTIRSGAGGIDAADWAEMLMRMYMRWAERHRYATEVFDTSYAEEAGIKSATFSVKAPYAYGTLSVEQGTHRLVRISPFDNQGRRQTSFAAVEVVPVLEQTDEIDIPDEDIRVDVFRSSGPGGQSVNTTDSAVRITHLPTGLVVSCQNEKSQLQNKASAMTILKAKLLAAKHAEEKAKLDKIRGDVTAAWGDQMRSYVLHPYQMVKDLRTNYEEANTSGILDGDIDAFIEAGIRWRRESNSSTA
jgi:peptide chain release factor 2